MFGFWLYAYKSVYPLMLLWLQTSQDYKREWICQLIETVSNLFILIFLLERHFHDMIFATDQAMQIQNNQLVR